MSSRRIAAPMVAAAIVSLVVAVIGFIVAMVLNAFVLDEYDAYGEVPIPGSGTVQLPAGEVTISFHTLTTGSGGGLPVPSLKVRIVPPDGAPEPVVTESPGGTTTVNNDARVRVWVAQVADAGSYQVVTDGDVNGYISPRLAFGHGSQYGWVVWLFVGLFVLGLVELVIALWWSARTAKRPRPAGPQEFPVFGAVDAPTYTPQSYVPAPPSYSPTDQGVRLEQLKTLAALRDSGALTDAEFEAEKRRILDG